MSDPKRTSFMRYHRVHEILKGDTALSKKLGAKMHAVCKPDRTPVDFPVEVIQVTDEIHNQGLDAASMHKIDVIRLAHRLLVAKVPSVTTAVSPKAVKSVKPKPKLKSSPQAKVPESPLAESKAPVKNDGAASADMARAAPAYVRPYVPYVVGVAALSNLQAVLTLFEPFMANGDMDAKEVCQKANELIDDIHRRTVLPSAEKESNAG